MTSLRKHAVRFCKINDEPNILGVILQKPVSSHVWAFSVIHLLKDIEGMPPASIGIII